MNLSRETIGLRIAGAAACVPLGGLMLGACTQESPQEYSSSIPEHHAAGLGSDQQEGRKAGDRNKEVGSLALDCRFVGQQRAAKSLSAKTITEYVVALDASPSATKEATLGEVACPKTTEGDQTPKAHQIEALSAHLEVAGQHCLALSIEPETNNMLAFCPNDYPEYTPVG